MELTEASFKVLASCDMQVEKHCLDATSIDVWHVRPAAASAEQDTNASSSPVDKLQTESRHSTGGFGFPERPGSGLYH